ncbi:MAG: hypothetical protein R2849_23435 [Thermomicrobiales bacterium]
MVESDDIVVEHHRDYDDRTDHEWRYSFDFLRKAIDRERDRYRNRDDEPEKHRDAADPRDRDPVYSPVIARLVEQVVFPGERIEPRYADICDTGTRRDM